MPVAEIFLTAFIGVLFEKLTSGELLKLARLGGNDHKLKKLSENLEIIDALLGDAEDKQLTRRTVQQWLEDLRDLAYDIDDVLDELDTEVLRRKLMLTEEHGSSSMTSKIWRFIPACCGSLTSSTVMFNHRISSKIDGITSKLDDLANRRTDLMLIQSVTGRSDEIEEGWRTTTSLVVESHVYGRVKDRVVVLKLLLEGGESNHTGELRVIPIVGMGGVGKTTLAQLVYNDEQVKGHFDLMAWLCVAEDFNLLRMTNIIYRTVAKDDKEFKDLDSAQVSLKEKLSNKKFLFVLDDVWNENYGKWDLFRAPFLVGAPGSTIIVTTRIGGIAQFMGSIKAHLLQPLEDNDCLSLIALHALPRPNFDRHPDLKNIGEKIAKKCKGLPLAAKTLGGLLSVDVSLKHWENVLTSKAWDLPGGNNDIIPALRLSYHHLPPHLKHLFAYCSIFPKDYQFDVQDLILLWMAEGFLKQSGKKKMEELGMEYFNELVSRSFFQHSGDSESKYMMHDLMNDLAQFVDGKICFRLDDNIEAEEWYKVKVLPNSRHSSFARHEYDAFKKFKVFDGVRSLRTFLPLPIYRVNSWQDSYLSSKVVTDLLPKLRCLRVLSFSGYMNISEVPHSVGDLKHLRYLNFANTKITQVAESVCDLHNLQTLVLRGCYNLIQLPRRIQNLLNLRHLDIAGTVSLKQMPFGLGMLKSLHTLSKIVIDDGDGLKLSELKCLIELQGRLSIDGMQNVKSVQDAAAADLSGKQHIKELAFRWSNSSHVFQGEGLESAVLEVLKPQEGLASLEIESYKGTKLPRWVGDPSFSNMVHLTLSNCRKCISLPSLGHLPSLKKLFIKGMDRVKVVGPEFFGAGLPSECAFPSLETLSFQGMTGWEKWYANSANGDKNVERVFPRLAKLEISRCPRLFEVSLPQTPSLVELELTSCHDLVLRSTISLGLVKSLRIRDIYGFTILDERAFQFLGALEDLSIRSCVGIRHLWKEELACQILKALRSLSVGDCGRLLSLGGKEQVLPHNLENLELECCANLVRMPSSGKSLRKLSIYMCNKLQCCPHLPLKSEEHQAMSQSSRSNHTDGFPNLEVLAIKWCPGLKLLPTGEKLPTSLKSLHICDCVNMKEPNKEEDLDSSLESLHINNWANLKFIPSGWLFDFIHLTRVEIYKCQGIESFPERCFPTSLRDLSIVGCENLKYLCNDDQMMQSLTSLQKLTIMGCKNLEPFPDGLWPSNLEYLEIGGLKQPITEQGLHRLPTSLLTLIFWGGILSFSDVQSQLCTTLLRHLGLRNLVNLESLSVGLRNLTSLEQLHLAYCPKLRSLPEILLPNLSSLVINMCPHLKERCSKEKRDYWPSISHIPCLKIDGELM